jgi:VWFA-related protein
VLALAGPAAGSAQTQDAAADRTFGESVEVRVVNVDVIVADRDGRPVYGLDRGDFRIYEDGRPQEISNFYRVEGARVRTDAKGDWETIAPDSSFRRRILLLIDNNFVETPDRDRSVDALESYLDQKFDGSYDWGVIAVGDEVRVLEPFTADKLRVREALDRIKAMPTFGDRYRIDRNFLNDPVRIRRAQRAEASRQGDAASNEDPNENYLKALRFESKVNIASTLSAFQRTSTAMIQAFRAYSNLPGNKVLVWITGGVPMLPEYVFQGETTAAPGAPSSQDTELRGYQDELRKLVDVVTWEANAAQFKVYPVKATGLHPEMPQIDPAYRSSGATFSEAAYTSAVEVDDSDSAQLSVALGTGGLYLTSNRTLEDYERADQDSAAYYSLGYRPQRSEDGKLHDIRVEVTKPGLVARARKGYVDFDRDVRLERTLATPLPFPREKGTLPVKLSIDRRPEGGVVATVELPSSKLTFVPEGDFWVGRVKVFLTIHDAAGNLVDLVHEEKDLRFPSAQRSEALAGEFRYGLKFHLKEKGSYVVSVTLKDEATDEIGTGFTNLEI